MAITYAAPNQWTNEAIANAGHDIWMEDGIWRSTDDVAVQAIIDSHDPLPQAITDCVAAVKGEASAARMRYTTKDKSDVYREKERQATEYVAATSPGVDLPDMTGYEFVAIERDAKGFQTYREAAEWMLQVRADWLTVMQNIESVERSYSEMIRSATDLVTVQSTAREAIDLLRAI